MEYVIAILNEEFYCYYFGSLYLELLENDVLKFKENWVYLTSNHYKGTFLFDTTYKIFLNHIVLID